MFREIKYQKIAEIADEWEHDHDNLNYADDSYYWSKVREVIGDLCGHP